MTKSIFPNEVYLESSLEELLLQAPDGCRLQYRDKNGKSTFEETKKGKKYTKVDLTHADFSIGKVNYSYDNLFGRPTLVIDSGDKMQNYEFHDGDNKFRLLKDSDIKNNKESTYEYSEDGKSVRKTINYPDGTETTTDFLPIKEAGLSRLFSGLNRNSK